MIITRSPAKDVTDWFQLRYHVYDGDQLSVRKDGCITEYNSYLDARILLLIHLNGEQVTSWKYEGKLEVKNIKELGSVLTSSDPENSTVIVKAFFHLPNLAEEVQIVYRYRIKSKKGYLDNEDIAMTEYDVKETLKKLVHQLKKSLYRC